MYDLKDRWTSLLNKYSSDINQILDLYNLINKKYNSKFRYYHNLNHITGMLDLADKYKSRINDLDTFQFAVWFHDIIYKPYRNDNEEKSALLAFNLLNEIGVPGNITDNIRTIILLTKNHHLSEKENSTDYQLFLDIDLSILGSERSKYNDYMNNVRKEYFLTPQKIYNKHRIKLLSNLLNRDYIYFSDCFREKYENTARENIRYEIGLLSR